MNIKQNTANWWCTLEKGAGNRYFDQF